MRCSCKKADLKCTYLCSCCDCQSTAAEMMIATTMTMADYGLANDDELGGFDLNCVFL